MKTYRGVCVVVGSLTAAVFGASVGRGAGGVEPPETPHLAVETFTLPNGLHVALSHDPAAPRTVVSVVYHVGSKNERAGLTGFAPPTWLEDLAAADMSWVFDATGLI